MTATFSSAAQVVALRMYSLPYMKDQTGSRVRFCIHCAHSINHARPFSSIDMPLKMYLAWCAVSALVC